MIKNIIEEREGVVLEEITLKRILGKFNGVSYILGVEKTSTTDEAFIQFKEFKRKVLANEIEVQQYMLSINTRGNV